MFANARKTILGHFAEKQAVIGNVKTFQDITKYASYKHIILHTLQPIINNSI